MIFADSHFHLTEESSASLENAPALAGTINVSSIEEFRKAQEIKKSSLLQKTAVAFGAFSFFDKLDDSKAVLSLGKASLDLLDSVLRNNSEAVDAVGEAVLDALSHVRLFATP